MAVLKGITPIVVVHRYYEIRIKGDYNATFPGTGYSKYDQRWELHRANKIQLHEVYGIPQALDHIEELRRSRDTAGKLHFPTQEFEIAERTITTAALEVIVSPSPIF